MKKELTLCRSVQEKQALIITEPPHSGLVLSYKSTLAYILVNFQL